MRKLIGRIEEYLAGLLLAAITLLIVVQLVLLHVAPRLSEGLAAATPRLASPITTIVLALFIWATLLAVPAVTRRGSHLSLELLGRRVPAAWQRPLKAVLLVATLAFFVTLAVTGIKVTWEEASVQHNRFVGSPLPSWAVTVAIPLSAGLSCVRAVEAWREERRRGAQGGAGEGHEQGVSIAK